MLEDELERTAMLPAVRSSLADAKLRPVDEGAKALALRYAELLDAAAVEKQYVKSLAVVERAVESASADLPPQAADQLEAAFAKISMALAEHSTASDLGPKLLAAMTSLGLTPAARAEKGPVGAAGGTVSEMPSPLQAARDRARLRNAGA